MGVKDVASLKAQHASRASLYALAAGQAVVIFNRLAQPGVLPDINANGAIVRTDAALHAANIIGYHPTTGSDCVLGTFGFPPF